MDADPGIHDFEGGLYRRNLHAYALGTACHCLCHIGPAGAGLGVRVAHDLRIGLHLLHAGHILRGRVLAPEVGDVGRFHGFGFVCPR